MLVVNLKKESIEEFVGKYGASALRSSDIYLCNDPNDENYGEIAVIPTKNAWVSNATLDLLSDMVKNEDVIKEEGK